MIKIQWKYFWESSFHTDMLIEFVEGNMDLNTFINTAPKQLKRDLRQITKDTRTDWYNYQLIQNRAVNALRSIGMSVKKVHQPKRIKHKVN